MHWLDLILILVICGFAAVEMARGFGKAAFDALFLYAALWCADAAAPLVGNTLKFGGGAAANHADADALLFVVFGLMALGISRFLYRYTEIDLGMFDKLLGLTAGLVAGVVVAHAMVRPMAMADPSGKNGAAVVASSAVGHELLDFPAYHSLLNTFTGANTYRRSLPGGAN
jgi:uncharacterized membrane protein required for colicin V production